ncbi:unnamed protein product, partial [Effrenium voratum]
KGCVAAEPNPRPNYYDTMIPVVPTWLWGVALCVLSNCLTALGLVTQKLAHLQVEQSGGKSRYFKQPWWMAGMAAFVLGQVANIPAMALTPQTMLSCLGGLSLVFNSAYAHVLLGERLRSSEVLVMLAMVIGAGMVVSVTPVPKTHHESTQIFGALLHRAFLLTAVGVTAFLGVLGLLAYFVATPLKPFFLGLTCAACGSAGPDSSERPGAMLRTRRRSSGYEKEFPGLELDEVKHPV